MCAVGELDQDDAYVAHHREQHLAERLRLGFLAALELDLVELRDAVDELGNVGSEALRQLVLGRRGIFDDVVQNRRDDRIRVEMQIRQDGGGGHRMRDVGLAGEALLAFVGGGAELGGLFDAGDLLGRQIGADRGQQLF